jgi:hypothetical protein
MTAAQFNRLWAQLESTLLQRRWDYLRETWLRHIPIINPPGAVPQRVLADLTSELVTMPAPQLGKLQSFTFPIGEVPELMFREGVYWLHKALHVLGASETHAAKGMPTWSLSSAYQSAFFSARASMAFLGLAISEVEKTSFVINLCRDMRLMSDRQYGTPGAFREEAQFYTLGILFDHRQIWSLLQRLLRITTRPPWPSELSTYIAQMNASDITKQRHNLHYQLLGWYFNDLYTFEFPSGFDDVQPTGSGRELFDTSISKFSFSFAAAILRIGLDPFLDICRYTNRLTDEKDRLTTCLIEERHPVLFEKLQLLSAAPKPVSL